MKPTTFTTTLNPETKKKLNILAANDSKNVNEYIEKITLEKWKEFVKDVK